MILAPMPGTQHASRKRVRRRTSNSLPLRLSWSAAFRDSEAARVFPAIVATDASEYEPLAEIQTEHFVAPGAAAEETSDAYEVTPEEAYAVFDRQARRYLKIGGDEFLRAWDAGEFDDCADEPQVVRVAMLLPLVR